LLFTCGREYQIVPIDRIEQLRKLRNRLPSANRASVEPSVDVCEKHPACFDPTTQVAFVSGAQIVADRGEEVLDGGETHAGRGRKAP
jgi:hypothetical protein